MKDNFQLFIEEISKRKIEFLIHFTPTINLYSILEHGSLMSRSKLENLDIDQFDIMDYVQFTDQRRYDDTRFINLSISAPNSFLFSKFRERTIDDLTISWCVLKIDTKHIYDLNTQFAVTNAASSAARKQFGISGDLEKFRLLFKDILRLNTSYGIRIQNRESLKSHYTTDVQAEVLVMDSIPISSIMNICFEDDNSLAQARAAMSEFDTSKFVVDPLIFNPNRMI